MPKEKSEGLGGDALLWATCLALGQVDAKAWGGTVEPVMKPAAHEFK